MSSLLPHFPFRFFLRFLVEEAFNLTARYCISFSPQKAINAHPIATINFFIAVFLSLAIGIGIGNIFTS
jgi:hypothetical protein